MEPIWIERIGNLYSSILSVGLFTYLFGLKRRGLMGWGAAVIAAAAYYCVVTYLNLNYQFEGLAALLYSLVLFGYGCLALEGRAERKAVFCVAWDCALLLTSLGSFVLLHLFTGLSFHDLSHPQGSARTAALLCGCLLKGFVALALVSKKHLGVPALPVRGGWRWLFGLLSYFLLSLEVFLLMIGAMVTGEGTELLLIFYIVLAGLFFALLYALYQNLMWRRENREARYLRESMAQQAEYVDSFSRFCQEMRLLRHDARGHLVTVHILLKEGKRDQAAAYLRETAGQRRSGGESDSEDIDRRGDGVK